MVIGELARVTNFIGNSLSELDSKSRIELRDQIRKSPGKYIAELYERENNYLYDLAKLGVFTIAQLEEMCIGDYYNYFVKELKDVEKMNPTAKKKTE